MVIWEAVLVKFWPNVVLSIEHNCNCLAEIVSAKQTRKAVDYVKIMHTCCFYALHLS